MMDMSGRSSRRINTLLLALRLLSTKREREQSPGGHYESILHISSGFQCDLRF